MRQIARDRPGWMRLVVVAATAGLVLAGCGGDDDGADTGSDTESTAEAPEETEAPATDAGTSGETAAEAALLIKADTVSGPLNIPDDQRGSAVCVLQSRFARNSAVVWRASVLDGASGDPLDDTMLESVVVELADGQTFDMRYGPHPRDNPAEFFWTAAWEIPADYAVGTVGYTITATAADGRTATFQPFQVAPSLLTVEEEVLETIEES